MTSNLGSEHILKFAAETAEASDTQREVVREEMEKELDQILKGHFRPEFLNRIDATITFGSLSRENIREIIAIQLGRIQKRLEGRNIQLNLTDHAIEYFIDRGYEPIFGARPLKRVLQKELETGLAKNLLTGEIKDGDSVVVDYVNGELDFQLPN